VSEASLRPEHPVPRSLARLAEEFGFEIRGEAGEAEIEGVSITSRAIEGGDLYVALPGRNAHGADYAAEAAEAGAAAVLTDPAGAARIPDGIPVLVTADPRAALGAVASWVYRTDSGLPDLYAVTGTNGKTSVVHLLDGILAQLGILSALTSTAERRIGDVRLPSSLTTPEASDLHAMLARMKEAGVRAAAIEVSAQALTRHRNPDVRPERILVGPAPAAAQDVRHTGRSVPLPGTGRPARRPRPPCPTLFARPLLLPCLSFGPC